MELKKIIFLSKKKTHDSNPIKLITHGKETCAKPEITNVFNNIKFSDPLTYVTSSVNSILIQNVIENEIIIILYTTSMGL